MRTTIDPEKNYRISRDAIGYLPLSEATQEDYDRIGFMSGLEVHQQLLTRSKLFCRCPAGYFNSSDQYDAELIRHMRPTLSELGEYDGTALMEFKTRKEIVYRVKHETCCTYDVDDTPPFPIDREALDAAIRISLLANLNIVGEVHITRKQYLDGSIPTGFQRTAIIGVEGELALPHKKIRLIQLSIEEDSCREISDVGHTRVYKTDRLGMPLIELVTYPELNNPHEVQQACNYIRFLTRSTGQVRTGMGAGREDVNVSCKGGTRVEIKGVAHTRWIPALTHNEAFRQWALLNIRDRLLARIESPQQWSLRSTFVDFHHYNFSYPPLRFATNSGQKIVAVCLPGFRSILSHFTQPGHPFARDISDRLKVIACLEHPNMTHDEAQDPILSEEEWNKIGRSLDCEADDALLLFWGPQADIDTALDTITERCQLAMEGVPPETRKSLTDGTTIFERVLPGADRMYPDTDSAPIPLSDQYIDDLSKALPLPVIDRINQMIQWEIPVDTHTYILKRDLFPLLQQLIVKDKVPPRFAGTLLGHHLRHTAGHVTPSPDFTPTAIADMLRYLKEQKLQPILATKMLPIIYEHPQLDMESVLTTLHFRRITQQEILDRIPFLLDKWRTTGRKHTPPCARNWIMGQLRNSALGNVNLTLLAKNIDKLIKETL